ncbi:MAG: hypothetical protein M1338_04710 [Patescibacteria group bacterium]|nr:hypothetical protein [Patescibacteria group bacterium]
MIKNRFSKIIIIAFIASFVVQPFLYVINLWPTEKAVAATTSPTATTANSNLNSVLDNPASWNEEGTFGETGEAKGNLISQINSINGDINDIRLFALLENNKINLDAYDLSQLLIYKNIATRLNTDKNLMAEYKASGQVPQSILKEFGLQSLPTYDTRTIQALIKLVTPKESGGMGREYIKVSSIVKGFRSDKQATNGAEKSTEQNTEDPENYFSPHNSGQAADITQIDYLRGSRWTKVTTRQSGVFGSSEKTQDYYEKLPKIPVDISWQGGGPNGAQGGNLNSKSMNGLFEMPLQFISSGLQNWLADQGIDIGNLQVDSKNLANLPFSVALPQFIETLGLPSNYTPGFDFSDNLLKLGANKINEATNGALPIAGLTGLTPKQMFTNLGREKITESLELPSNSLIGNNSYELLSQIGRRKIEQELKIGSNVLINVSGPDDFKQKIGQGLIEKTFSLKPGTFVSNDLNTLKKNLNVKWEEFSQNPTLTDNRLMISVGETQKLINGSLTVTGYKQQIGENILNNLADAYSPRMLGAALGIEETQPQYPIGVGNDKFLSQENLKTNNELKNYFNNTLTGKLLLGQDSVFKDIGAETLARSIGTEKTSTDAYGQPLAEASGNREYFKQWLSTGQVPRIIKDGANYPAFDLETMAAKIGLRTADLETIFIKNDPSLRNEIFYRIGYNNFAENITVPKNTPDTSWNIFYIPRLDNINSLAKSLKSTKIQNIVQQIKDHEQTSQETLAKEMQYDPEAYARQKMSEIQIEMLALESRSSSAKEKIEEMRLNVNEIIEGRELINIAKLEADNLTFSNPINVGIDFNQNLLNALQNNKGSIDDLLTNTGAETWAGILGIDNTNDLIDIAKTAKKDPANSANAIRNKLSTGVLNKLAEQINNGLSSTNYNTLSGYRLSGDDMANFFAGNSTNTLIKIGSPVVNQAMQFPAGLGLAEYFQDSNFQIDNLIKDGAMCRLYGYLGLGTPDIQKGQSDGDKIENLGRSYAESQLGLARGSLSLNSVDELIARNGKERALLAFGVQISADILIDKDTNPQRYEERINDLVNQLKDPHSALWNNPQLNAPIKQTLANADIGLSFQSLQNILDGNASPKDIAQGTKEIIGHKLAETNPDGTSKLNDYLGLIADFAVGEGTLVDLSNAFKDGRTADAFSILTNMTNANIDIKFNLGDGQATIGKGDFYSIIKDPKNAPKMILTRGMSVLSSLIKTGDNKTTGIIRDLLSGISNQVGMEPFNLNIIIPSEDNIFSVLYKYGVGQVAINGEISAFGQTYKGNIPVDLLHPLKDFIDVNLLPNNQKPLAKFQNDNSGLIINQIQKATKIPTFDLKDVGQKINDNLKFYDGELSNALRSWSAAGLKSAYDDLKKNSNMKPEDINAQDDISYETIRKAYLDPLLKYPVSTSEYRQINQDLDKYEAEQAQFSPGFKFSAEDRQAIIDDIYKQKRTEDTKLAQKGVRYASMDLAIYKLGTKDKWMTKLGPGFSRTMLEGDTAVKTQYFRGFLGRAVDNLDDLDPAAKTILQGFLSDPNYNIQSNVTGIAGTKLDQMFNKITCSSGTCAVGSGLGKAMLEYMQNPSGAQLSSDLVNSQLSGMFDTTLKLPSGTAHSIYAGYTEYQKSLKLYQKMQNTTFGSEAYKNGVIAKAKNGLDNKTTDLCILAANIALAKTFSEIDGKLGLPPGTTSTLVSAAAYSMIAHTSFATALTKLVPKTNFSAIGMGIAIGIGLITGSINPQQAACMVAGALAGSTAGRLIGTLIGGPLGAVLGQVIGQIIGTIITDALMGKPETTITSSILYTAGGYYPYYEKELSGCTCGDKNSCRPDGREQTDCDNLQLASGQHLIGVDEQYLKAIADNKIIDQNAYQKLQTLEQQYDIIPSQQVDLLKEGQVPETFHGETNDAFSAGVKPAVDYKIKVLLGNLLNLDATKNPNNLILLPTQIQTYQVESVKYWNTLRDKMYGDGTAGSADKLLETARKGMGWNPNLFDRVHFSY